MMVQASRGRFNSSTSPRHWGNSNRVLAPGGLAAVAALSSPQRLPLRGLVASRVNIGPPHPRPTEMQTLFEDAGFTIREQHRVHRSTCTSFFTDVITVGSKPGTPHDDKGDELRAYLFAKRLDELGSCLRRTSYRDLDAAGAVAREPGVGSVVAEVQSDLVRDDTIPTGFIATGSLKLTPASARSSIRDQAGERNSQDRSTGLDHSSRTT